VVRPSISLRVHHAQIACATGDADRHGDRDRTGRTGGWPRCWAPGGGRGITSQPWLAEYLEQGRRGPMPPTRLRPTPPMAARPARRPDAGPSHPPTCSARSSPASTASGPRRRSRTAAAVRSGRAERSGWCGARCCGRGRGDRHRGHSRTRDHRRRLAGTRLALAASATAKLHATPSGLAIELTSRAAAPAGPYYQA
jgi:hypothetical protein